MIINNNDHTNDHNNNDDAMIIPVILSLLDVMINLFIRSVTEKISVPNLLSKIRDWITQDQVFVNYKIRVT